MPPATEHLYVANLEKVPIWQGRGLKLPLLIGIGQYARILKFQMPQERRTAMCRCSYFAFDRPQFGLRALSGARTSVCGSLGGDETWAPALLRYRHIH